MKPNLTAPRTLDRRLPMDIGGGSDQRLRGGEGIDSTISRPRCTGWRRGTRAARAATILAFAPVVFPSVARCAPPTWSDGVKRVIYQSSDEYDQARPLGDGIQQKTGMAQCRDRPNIIYLTQDVAAPGVSLDGGVSWYLPHWIGMKSHLTSGVMCDPIDPRRVAVVTCEEYGEVAGEAGLYVSFDGGQTATRKVRWNPDFDGAGINVHKASQGIGFNPASANGGKMDRWVFIGGANAGTRSGNFPVYESRDGMLGFAKRTDLAVSTYGMVKHVIGDPTNNNRYLVAFDTGLWWLNNAHTGVIGLTKIAGAGALPAGAVNGPPHISADGQTIIVGVEGNGVWKSTDGGGAWTRISAQPNLHKLFVNWMNPAYMAISRNQNGDLGIPMFSADGGATFAAAASANIEKRPGYGGSLNLGYQHNHVAWINSSGELWYAGRQTSPRGANNDYRSVNGGGNLVLSMKGMNGLHLGGLLDGRQIFDPDAADRNRIGHPAIDIGWSISTDGLKSFESRRVPPEVAVKDSKGKWHATVHGAILHPALDRAVIGMNDNSNGYLYVYDNGAWTYPANGVKTRYQGLCYIKNGANYTAFGGALKSDDWITWTSMPDLGADFRIVGCTHTAAGAQAVFAVDTEAGTRNRNLKRSADYGVTWTTVLTTDYMMMGGDGWVMGPFVAHPGNKDIVFTQSDDRSKINRWDLTSGSGPTSRVPTVLDPTNGTGAGFKLAQLAIDPRHANIMYARNSLHGATCKLMRSEDGGATWTNLSTLVPDGRGQFMAVHPTTGELLYTTSSGMWLIEPPYAQTGKLGDGLPTPGNMLRDDYLDPAPFSSNNLVNQSESRLPRAGFTQIQSNPTHQ